jgi:hypothetical protein
MSKTLGRRVIVTKNNEARINQLRSIRARDVIASDFIAAPAGVIYDHTLMGTSTVSQGSSFIPNGHAVYLAIRDANADLQQSLEQIVDSKLGQPRSYVTVTDGDGNLFTLYVSDGALTFDKNLNTVMQLDS